MYFIKIPFFVVNCVFLFCVVPLFSICGYVLMLTPNIFDNTSYIIQKILNVKIHLLNNTPIIKEGIILTNHRCFADMVIDPYIFKCPGIGRYVALLFSGIMGLTSTFVNRSIVINRNDNRNVIYAAIKNSPLYYFYPEGTRCSHMTLPEKSVNIDLKCGLLKNIYEDSQNKCIQIIIHKNKDYIINEKTFTMSYGVKLYYNVGKSIYTHDYATFELFIDKIIGNGTFGRVYLVR